MAKFNPFNPNSVVAPNLFAGRVSQIDDICKKLSQVKHGMPSSFFLFGERGIGKTALSKLIKYIAGTKDKDFHNLNFLSSYYSVEKGQEIGSVLQESINRITDGMDKTLIEEIGTRVGNLFKNGKFKIGAFNLSVDIEAKEKEKNKITIKDQSVSILSNIIRSITKDDTEEKKDGLLMIIDEVHNLKNLKDCSSILRSIITSLDVENLGFLSIILIGYEEDVRKFFSVDSSSRRTFDMVELRVMPLSESVELLEKGFSKVGVKWDKKTLENSATVTGGYPHSLQLIGHNLIEADTDNYIDNEDWKKVLTKTAVDLCEKDFAPMYSFRKICSNRDKLLIFLAEETDIVKRKDLIPKRIITDTYRALSELKTLGAIKEDDDGNIYLHSHLFRAAILFDVATRKYLSNTQK